MSFPVHDSQFFIFNYDNIVDLDFQFLLPLTSQRKKRRFWHFGKRSTHSRRVSNYQKDAPNIPFTMDLHLLPDCLTTGICLLEPSRYTDSPFIDIKFMIYHCNTGHSHSTCSCQRIPRNKTFWMGYSWTPS